MNAVVVRNKAISVPATIREITFHATFRALGIGVSRCRCTFYKLEIFTVEMYRLIRRVLARGKQHCAYTLLLYTRSFRISSSHIASFGIVSVGA